MPGGASALCKPASSRTAIHILKHVSQRTVSGRCSAWIAENNRGYDSQESDLLCGSQVFAERSERCLGVLTTDIA